jgi:hypothetical protein
MRSAADAAFGNFQNLEDLGALPFCIFAKVFAPKPTLSTTRTYETAVIFVKVNHSHRD